jgi:membrane-associated phospholipid phosphatase
MFKGFFYKFSDTVLQCFRGYPLLLQIASIPLTTLIVLSGFDWLYFTQTQNAILHALLFPAALIGFLVPVLAVILTLFVGNMRKDRNIKNIAFALGQSAFVALAISSFYKVFTGRVPPPRHLLTLVDTSRGFHFGILREGIFWGWPSSHTTVAFAMSVTLMMLFPRNKLVRYIALAYACYIGLGVSIGIHWFSEFIAGILIGTAIGIVVGKNFQARELDVS